MSHYYISGYGITKEKRIDDDVEENEIIICNKYLSRIKEKDNYGNISSYGLKKNIQDYLYSIGDKNSYVSNGAFIKALQQNGLNYKIYEPNVAVKFTNKDLNLAILEDFFIEIEKFELLLHIFDKSRACTCKTSIKEILSIMKNKDIKITKEEIFFLLKDIQGIRIQYNEHLYSNFLDYIEVNISKQKLNRFLEAYIKKSIPIIIDKNK